jgi:hypothetical protein
MNDFRAIKYKLIIFNLVLVEQVKYTEMASLPSDFLRHSLNVPLGGCVTRAVVPGYLQNSVFFPHYSLYLIQAQYILAVRILRIPSRNDSGRLNPQGRFFHSRVLQPN